MSDPMVTEEFGLMDYRNAPSGVGPLSNEWKDKPHRLIYDLATALATEREKTSQWWDARAELDRVSGLLDTERTARESLEKELSQLRSGLEPGKAGKTVDWVFDFANSEFGRSPLLSDGPVTWIVDGVAALRKERDGLAFLVQNNRALLLRRFSVAEHDTEFHLRSECTCPDCEDYRNLEPIEEYAENVGKLLAAHDARLTAPLERRVEELERALRFRNRRHEIERAQSQEDYGPCDCLACVALASTPREGQREPEKQV